MQKPIVVPALWIVDLPSRSPGTSNLWIARFLCQLSNRPAVPRCSVIAFLTPTRLPILRILVVVKITQWLEFATLWTLFQLHQNVCSKSLDVRHRDLQTRNRVSLQRYRTRRPLLDHIFLGTLSPARTTGCDHASSAPVLPLAPR